MKIMDILNGTGNRYEHPIQIHKISAVRSLPGFESEEMSEIKGKWSRSAYKKYGIKIIKEKQKCKICGKTKEYFLYDFKNNKWNCADCMFEGK